MKLSFVLAVVLGELGIGTVFFVCLQQTDKIRKSFFIFQSWLVAICFLWIAIIYSGNGFYLLFYFLSATFPILAVKSFRAERFKRGKAMLLAAAFLASFLFQNQMTSAAKPYSGFLIFTNIAAGAFLFGWVSGAMILGHWYLIMQNLSFVYFQRATLQLLVAIVIRALCFSIIYLWAWVSPRHSLTAEAFHPFISDPLFFWMRILWGFILPAIFGFMAWRCARMGSTQAGTGLLYIATVSVLIGEILAGFLR